MDDIEFSKLIEIFDSALCSTDPIVKEQLSKLLMIATLANRQGSAAEQGPLSTIVNGYADLVREVKKLKQQVDILESDRYTMASRNSYKESFNDKYLTDKYYKDLMMGSNMKSLDSSFIKSLMDTDFNKK